ncbi:MAG: hypothetical protein AAF988_06640 [Pseudomonadota bacterium]
MEIPKMEIVHARHKLAILFVEAVGGPAEAAHDNVALLNKIMAEPEFSPELYEDCIDNPWRMESIYTENQNPLTIMNGAMNFHCWTIPGDDSAAGSVTILTMPRKSPGKRTFLPSAVFIPENLIGARINGFDVAGEGEVDYEVLGVGWGTTFSCCGSESAVDFHTVVLADGELRSQPRPSSIACADGITEAYNTEGLIQLAGRGPLHDIQHMINDARELGSHCHEDRQMDFDAMRADSKTFDM